MTVSTRYGVDEMRALIVIVALALLSAAAAVAPASAPRNPVDPAIASGAAKRALDAATGRWRRARIASYRYEVQRACFCPPTGWRRVVVTRGRPARATSADVRDYATVPRLLRLIRQAIDDRATRLRVTYGSYGVPREVSIDRVANVADEEIGVATRRFRRR